MQDIPYWITRFTNIRDRDVKGKPIFSEFASKISKMLEGTVFVAHNVNFDYSFLLHEMKRIDENFNFPKICTVMLGRKLVPELQSANLDAMSAYFDIEIDNRHRALPDAQATAQILNEFISIAKEKYSSKTFFDLEKVQWLRINGYYPYGNEQLFKDSPAHLR